MDKIWLKQYPPGTPTEIDPNEYSSLKELIEKSCKQFSDRIAYLQMDCRLSYEQLDQLSRPLRRVAAEPGPQERRPHRDHAAQHIAVSDRRCAARCAPA